MPTNLPVRRLAIVRADGFPLRTLLSVAFLAIATGLWFGVADESAWLPPFNSAAHVASLDPALQPLAGHRLAP